MFKKKNTKKKDFSFKKPTKKLGPWKFDKKIAKIFPDMIKRSIPGYSNILTITGMLAKRFVKPNSFVYDLGCSLGAATLSILSDLKIKNSKIIAIDNSISMIKLCKKNVSSYKTKIPVEIILEDILDTKIKNASMVVLNFTLQFIIPAKRQKLINRIYKGLNPGGLLILSEKFNFNDKKINNLLFNMHYDFKHTNGYSIKEIYQKKNMLHNIMITDSIQKHKSRLNIAGFNNYELYFQYFNFGSILAIKSKNR
ncbi:carboxy-S-adenosyl-L-methionine synthase CmoA [Arsenophonus symbiont of Ornithomya chloropus]|uniref:carboxy-S-adenosyl-L-methionine synthase CmoA n=1 Tax=Arsenophonus symbiont of Ornithomya chloropus TaxID=634121 RepID=UPI0032B260BF